MIDDRTARADDKLYGEAEQPSTIVLSDDIEAPGHHVPEKWLRARVRGWLEMIESPDLAYWVGTYTADGRWIFCSSNADTWAPKPFRQEYAMDVCRHINKQCSMGGAWLVGWIRGGREFYMLWKDPTGDLQIPIECNKPFIVLRNYTLSDWETHCQAALGVYSEWQRNMDLSKSQQMHLAQGEKPREAGTI
jgi:hypothetical protein